MKIEQIINYAAKCTRLAMPLHEFLFLCWRVFRPIPRIVSHQLEALSVTLVTFLFTMVLHYCLDWSKLFNYIV